MNLLQLTTLLSNPDISQIITGLKTGINPADLTAFRKQFDPALHETMDSSFRPDKIIKTPTGETSRVEKVNRVALGMQELITERAVSFLFGNPVSVQAETISDNQEKVLAAFKRILLDNKIDSFNAETALELFRCTQVAECWFPVEKTESHTDYGFSTRFKLRVVSFKPWEGNQLYPMFDETGDMIAFSRGYVLVEEKNRKVDYFETYTATEKVIWKKDGSEWVEVARTPNLIGKIPVVYARQDSVEWATVQNLIDRLEKLLSNYADTNDYHGSPTIFVKGEVAGWAQKGESGKIIQGTTSSSAEYLSWSQAPEMVKLEIETMFRLIYSLSQTPDISFDAVKGLGTLSGIALKLLFLDAHLKVKKKQRVFDAYLDRRTSIIKSYIGYLSTRLKTDAATLTIETEIKPYMINDEQALIDLLATATGGKAVLSQKSAVAQSGLVTKADEEYDQLQTEQTASQLSSVSEPSF